MFSILRQFLAPLPDPNTIDWTTEAGLKAARRCLKSRADEALFRRLNEKKAGRQPERHVDYLRALYFLQKRHSLPAIEALKEELRYFPDNGEASALLRKLNARSAQNVGDQEFRELLTAVRPYTMLSAERLWSLWQRAREVCEANVPGNFVECGVAAGGSSALLAVAISRYSKAPRRLFACDSFSGMPAPTSHDTHAGQDAESSGWGTGTCAAPKDSLIQACRSLGVEELVEPVVGYFEETLPVNRERFGQIALLHLDGDWYSSTRAILDNLFDQVPGGGRLQIDDYGHWDGCRKAVDEFARERGLTFEVHPIDFTGVWLAK